MIVEGGQPNVGEASENFVAPKTESVQPERREAAATVEDAQRFFDVFSEGQPAEKLRVLESAGVLDRVIPEFKANKRLTQDVRWHGTETVGEHLIRAVGEIDAMLAQRPAFTTPGMERLLRMAAFFHDIGKNEDADNDPKINTDKRLGYREVQQRTNKTTGERVEAVSFFGHPAYGAEVFRKRIEQVQQLLGPEGHPISPGEAAMVSTLIRHHMQAIEGVVHGNEMALDALADSIIKNAYPVELRNARVPLSDMVQASTMLQELELRLADAETQKKLEPWKGVLALIEEKLPIEQELLHERTAMPLVGGTDLLALGLPGDMRQRAVLEEITAGQRMGTLVNRKQALLQAVERVRGLLGETALPLEEVAAKVEELSKQSAVRPNSARWENTELMRAEEFDGPIGPYKVMEWNYTPDRQLYADTPIADLNQELVESGKYPYLGDYITRHNIPIDQVFLKKVLTAGYENFIQMEEFVRRYGEHQSFLEVSKTKSPTMRAIEVGRVPIDALDPQPRSIVQIENGFQGDVDHTGAGLIHVGEQRLQKLQEFFQRPDESTEAMQQRFFKDGVIHTIGTAPVEFPSDYNPDQFRILTSEIKNEPGKYCSVILDRQAPGEYKLVTTLFSGNPPELRKYIRRSLQRLMQNAAYTVDQITPFMEQSNKFLTEQQLQPLQLEELQPAPVAPPKSKEVKTPKQPGLNDFLKDLQYPGQEIGKLMQQVNKVPDLNLRTVPAETLREGTSALAVLFPPRSDGQPHSDEEIAQMTVKLIELLRQS